MYEDSCQVNSVERKVRSSVFPSEMWQQKNKVNPGNGGIWLLLNSGLFLFFYKLATLKKEETASCVHANYNQKIYQNNWLITGVIGQYQLLQIKCVYQYVGKILKSTNSIHSFYSFQIIDLFRW